MNAPSMSAALRIIGERLSRHDDPAVQTDGRMILAQADEASRKDSEDAERSEADEELLMESNDFLNALRTYTERVSRRPNLPVDGTPASFADKQARDYPTR